MNSKPRKISTITVVVSEKPVDNDYTWYQQLTVKGVYFVTRINTNAKYRVTGRRSVLKEKGPHLRPEHRIHWHTNR